MASAIAVMNRVPRDKLPQVLSHVLEKRASAAEAAEVFSPEEMQQLVGMLQLSVEEIGEVVSVATTIFQQAAVFGDGVQSAVLVAEGVDSDVVAIIEKLWRKKGRPLADALAHAMPLEPVASLKQSLWQLQVELANRHLGKQSEPLAVFQLQIADVDITEKVDIEMKHGELLAFFQQLNSIQKALDETAAAAAP